RVVHFLASEHGHLQLLQRLGILDQRDDSSRREILHSRDDGPQNVPELPKRLAVDHFATFSGNAPSWISFHSVPLSLTSAFGSGVKASGRTRRSVVISPPSLRL